MFVVLCNLSRVIEQESNTTISLTLKHAGAASQSGNVHSARRAPVLRVWCLHFIINAGHTCCTYVSREYSNKLIKSRAFAHQQPHSKAHSTPAPREYTHAAEPIGAHPDAVCENRLALAHTHTGMHAIMRRYAVVFYAFCVCVRERVYICIRLACALATGQPPSMCVCVCKRVPKNQQIPRASVHKSSARDTSENHSPTDRTADRLCVQCPPARACCVYSRRPEHCAPHLFGACMSCRVYAHAVNTATVDSQPATSTPPSTCFQVRARNVHAGFTLSLACGERDNKTIMFYM